MLLSIIRIFLVFMIFMMVSFAAVLILDTLFTSFGLPLSIFIENSLQIFFVTWGLVKFGSKKDDSSETAGLSSD